MTFLIDSHCHLDDEAYDGEREAILAQLHDHEVAAVINPGSDEASSRAAVALAEHPWVYACVGTHPHEAKAYTDALEAQYRAWAARDKVVAIGEIGLDYHYDFSPREVQWRVFERQLQLASDLNLPVVIHSREAAADTIAILKNFGSSIRALLHSFSETTDDWDAMAPYGYYISLGGMVTFKNAPNPQALAAHVPEDRLLVETDGPYLSPVPYRGQTNRPWYAHESLAAIARLRGVNVEHLATRVYQNTLDFYRIPDPLATAERPVIREVVVVEGKDDVAAVKAAVDADCLITHGHGFGEEVLRQIEAAQERRGVILLTDPDYAGKRIRQRIRERVPQVKHAYIERRFSTKGDDIGVENASPEVIRHALQKARATLTTRRHTFSMEDLIQNGLEAAPGAKQRRIALGEALSLGYGNAKQLLARLNDYEITRAEFDEALEEVRTAGVTDTTAGGAALGSKSGLRSRSDSGSESDATVDAGAEEDA